MVPHGRPSLVIYVLAVLLLSSILPSFVTGEAGVGGSRDVNDPLNGFVLNDQLRLTPGTAVLEDPLLAVTPDGDAFVTWNWNGEFYLSSVLDGGDIDVDQKWLLSSVVPTQNNMNEPTHYMDVDAKGNVHMTVGGMNNGRYFKFDRAGGLKVNSLMIGGDVRSALSVKASDLGVAYILFINTWRDVHFTSVKADGAIDKYALTVIDNSMPGNYKNTFDLDGKENLKVATYHGTDADYEYAQISKDGVLQGAPSDLFNPSGWDPPAPDVAYTADGKVHFVWTTQTNNGIVRYMRIDNDGTVDVAPVDVATGSQGYPHIAGGDNGDVYMIWSDGMMLNERVAVAKVGRGEDQSSAVHFITDGSVNCIAPDIEMDSDSDLHMIWMENGVTGNSVVYRFAEALRGVEALFPPEELGYAEWIRPGQDLTFNMTVWNYGAGRENLTLRVPVALPPAWTVELTPSMVDLRANQTANIWVTVTASPMAQEGQAVSFHVEVFSKKDPVVNNISNEVTTTVMVDHGMELDIEWGVLTSHDGEAVEKNITVRNIGDVKEFAALNASPPEDWEVSFDIEAFSVGAGASKKVVMTVVPDTDALSGEYWIPVNLSYSVNRTVADTDTVRVKVPVKRELNMWTPVLQVKGRSYETIEWELSIENVNNAADEIVVRMGFLSSYSIDLLNITFEPEALTLGPGGTGTVMARAVPLFDADLGEFIEFSAYASSDDPAHVEATLNLTIVISESLVILQVERPDRTTEPGKTVNFDLTLTNAGELDEDVTLEHTGLPAAWNVTITVDTIEDPGIIVLPTFETAMGTLVVRLPNDQDDVGRKVEFFLMARYGNKVFSVNLTIEVVDPTLGNVGPVFVSEPIQAAVVGTEYTYQAKATDENENDLIGYLLLSGPIGMGLDPETGIATWTPTEGDVGDHSVTIMATDGKEDAEQIYILTVTTKMEGKLLSCTIFSPVDGDKVSGIARVSGKAYFPGLQGHVEVRVDDGDWKKASGSDMWTYDIDTRDRKKGDHVIWARAVMGGSNSTPVSVNVKFKPTEEGIGSGMGDWLPILLMIIVAVVVLILLLRRRLFPSKGEVDVEDIPEYEMEEMEEDMAEEHEEPMEEPLPEEPDTTDFEEVRVEEDIFDKLDMEEPDDILGASTMEAEAEPPEVEALPVKGRTPVVKTRVSRMGASTKKVEVEEDSEISKLEKEFDEEDEVDKEKKWKKEKDKVDIDLDDILKKLSEGSDKKGGG